MISGFFRKVVMAFWQSIYRAFGPTVPKLAFLVFCRDKKDEWRKVMQIRGGTTSRSALLDVSCPFMILISQSCLQAPFACVSPPVKAYTNVCPVGWLLDIFDR